ncbi:MAG: hypothetical protein UU73_C0001G0352 [Candidatus Daviesbacteria bacterium GW2011_GWA1_41_61]|uniref:Uncharacterized protein n=1 Tax=Candidatus Daviesbacteria bacterium GW2011_GWA2_40_9 TaxID=1618424 RepID=A0A0G0WDV7_9BACT|nr:MAG: hypothetical protein UU29_C0012G0008 [Candidatus Daviesbacteria bacterium GW2011_GWA2_40_9]KKR93171.1 MAG: hypothetical protein UU44_C0004G0353 [Candidatus Daviesbacteria bacterium GW2011_GWB1_41_15]KKS15715.1 MAG: hypothetical protein UU73_C0001G0352 [Candidatus Daviesbacteria bacterium GW2011_GWA1_41_61]
MKSGILQCMEIRSATKDFSVETGEGSKSGKEILEQLSKTGKFVFHGSPQKLENL